MPKILDVVAITGKYEKEGVEKNNYKTVGMIIEKDGKKYLKLDHLVTVDSNGKTINFFNLFTPRPKGDKNAQPQSPAAQPSVGNEFDGTPGFDDDIPFN